MKKEISPILLKKFLKGTTTPEESKEVNEWYSHLQLNHEESLLLEPQQEEELQQRIFNKIKTRTIDSSGSKSKPRPFLNSTLRWAASISILLTVGVGAFLLSKTDSQVFQDAKPVAIQGTRVITNTSETIAHQTLSDGSAVSLQPNSSIEFPEVFSKINREVQLTGEAFFDVSKDKLRPFVITTGDVTIKVLGTSFNVKAYENEEEITVAVKTGKVMVSSKVKSSPNPQSAKTNDEIILTPNQEVVYSTISENFLKKLAEKPVIILAQPTLFEMSYDGTPVTKIFEVLEENYGIEIKYDQDILNGCSLTTTMAEEGFFERIEIICKAIDAQYEIIDSKVVVTSDGCL
jgi:ferric-dicitrate binding protein FerR (iron transport regulator)